MAKKKKMTVPEKILKFIAVAFVTGIIMFALGMVLEVLNNAFGSWSAIASFAFALIFLTLSTVVRKGEEKIDAGLLARMLLLTGFFAVLDKIPFKIPFISFIVATNFLSLVLVVSTIWLSEGIVQRVWK